MDKDTHQPMELDIATEFSAPTWEEWKQAVEETLKGVPYEKAMITKTYEGIDLKPIYRMEDLQGLKHLSSLPGQAPFIRGNNPEGFTRGGWIIAQPITAWNPKQANQILKDELNRGLSGINIKLDYFTQCALNPTEDSFDIDGVWLSNLEDMCDLFEGIDLSAVPLFINGGEAGVMILGLVNAYLTKQKLQPSVLNGFIGFDLLSLLVIDGELPYTEKDMWLPVYQMSAWAAAKAPNLRTILLDGTVWGNHGASATLELGYLISTANTYIKAMLDLGMTIEQIAPRFQMNLTLGSNLFMEIAKVRAARLLWAELLASYGAGAELQKIWIHGVTSYFNKTIYDPYVNMLRTTTEGFSGVIGGVDSMEILPFDITQRPDAEFSRRIARNQQIILQEEAHLDRVIDPTGGCYYVETLTAQLAQLAWKKMQSIEEAGGTYQAIKDAVIQEELTKLAMERMQNVDKRKDVFVGINMFANPLELPLEPIEEPCECEWKENLERIQFIQASQRAGLVTALNTLSVNHKDVTAIDSLADTFMCGATLDELFAFMYPEESEVEAPELPLMRATIGLESLRERVIEHQQEKETVLSVFMANMGPIPQHKARADFATGFLQVGGFYIAGNDGFPTPEAAIEAALFSQAQAVCICSTDDTYPELVPLIISGIKSVKPEMIFILAGYPTDLVESFKSMGIDIFVHLRANLFDTLKELGNRMGVQL